MNAATPLIGGADLRALRRRGGSFDQIAPPAADMAIRQR
jgi:hypothetical protein